MITLGEAALTCPWLGSEWSPDGFDTHCEAFEAWASYRRSGEALDETTLVEWLESPEERRRELAKEKLWRDAERYRANRALASRIIAAAAVERSFAVLHVLGVVVGRIDLEKTGTTDVMVALGTEHPDHILRGDLLRALLATNPRSTAALDLARAGLTDEMWTVRASAVAAVVGSGPPDVACEAALVGVRDEHRQVQQEGIRAVIGKWPIGPDRPPLCRPPFGVVLDALEVRLGVAENVEWGQVLERICTDPASTTVERARAATDGRAMAARTNAYADFRAAGLAAATTCAER